MKKKRTKKDILKDLSNLKATLVGLQNFKDAAKLRDLILELEKLPEIKEREQRMLDEIDKWEKEALELAKLDCKAVTESNKKLAKDFEKYGSPTPTRVAEAVAWMNSKDEQLARTLKRVKLQARKNRAEIAINPYKDY